MKDHPTRPTAQVHRRFEGVGHERRCHVVVHLPADETSAAEVEDARKVEPTLACRDIGNVACPGDIGLSGGKAPHDEVRKRWGVLGRDRRADPSALCDADELVEVHQALDALVVDDPAAAAQLSCDAGAPVVLVRVGVDLPDLTEQLVLGQPGGTWTPGLPVVVARG